MIIRFLCQTLLKLYLLLFKSSNHLLEGKYLLTFLLLQACDLGFIALFSLDDLLGLLILSLSKRLCELLLEKALEVPMKSNSQG